jgi:arylsulfate sulfotransferase
MPSKSLRYSCVPGLILLASGCSRQLPLGQVTATNNPQVAMYTVNAPANARVSVQFGVDTNYGLTTWSQLAPPGGGPVSIFVAGMRALTVYHIRGTIESSDGSKRNDDDRTFTTGALPDAQLPNVKVTTASGIKPQSGIEMVNLLSLNTPVPIFATDLSGNLIWSYQFQRSLGETIQPIKLLANGHLLVVISPGSTTPIAMPPPPGTVDSLREIDLAGDTIREITIDDLNKRLASAGFDLTVSVFHHDVLPLANGHWIALTNTVKQFTDLPDGMRRPVSSGMRYAPNVRRARGTRKGDRQ